MSKHYNHPLMAKSATHNSSGIAFIGSVDDSFHMIIRCPIFVYTVIKKALSVYERPVKTSFYSGSMPIKDLVLPQYRGTFNYVSPTGKKAKYQAGFIYPLTYDESFAQLNEMYKVVQSFELNNWQYYDNQNKSLRTLVCEGTPIGAILHPFDYISTF